METYQLYHRFSQPVLAFPPQASEDVGAVDLPFKGFACCSLCDGSGETPQVPPYLPRPAAKGEYSWGAFLKDQELWVIVERREEGAEQIVSGMESIEHLILFEPEGRWFRTFVVNEKGEIQEGGGSYSHGPRLLQADERHWSWRARRTEIRPGCWRTLWRLSSSDILPLLKEGRLKFSLSVTSLRSLEGVAWGAYGIWLPRFDECGELLFEEEVAPLRVPRLREVEVDYSPEEASIRLRTAWEGAYLEEEFIPQQPTELWRPKEWDYFTIRVNGRLQRLNFGEESHTFGVKNGFNEIHISTRGGTAYRAFFEVNSDHQWELPAFIPEESEETLVDFRAWSEAVMKVFLSLKAPPFVKYASWMGRLGSALAIRWKNDPAFREAYPEAKEWMLATADYLLSLQREDGTFSGYHMGTGIGRVPWQGGAYDSGQVGEFWIRAYDALGEERYLIASERLVSAYKGYRIELNQNYAAFGIFHLAAHYEITQSPEALSHIQYYLEKAVTRNVLPIGFPAGHNYYSVYGGIILRGILRGSHALEKAGETEAARRYRAVARRMGNQVFSRLQECGAFDSRDRHFNGELLWLEGLFDLSLLFPELELRNTLLYILRKGMEAVPAKGLSNHIRESELSLIRALSHGVSTILAISPAVQGFLFCKRGNGQA